MLKINKNLKLFSERLITEAVPVKVSLFKETVTVSVFFFFFSLNYANGKKESKEETDQKGEIISPTHYCNKMF